MSINNFDNFLIVKSFTKISVFVLLLITSFFVYSSVSAVSNSFPRRANYFLKWQLTENEARELAKWDLVVLDMETQVTSPELLKKMRLWNPNIIMLVYLTPQEVKQDATSGSGSLRRQFAGRLQNQWFLQKSNNAGRLSWWPGTYLLNVTNDCPISDNLRYNQYLVNFVVNNLLGSGLWDGVFYDNAWDSISYFAGTDIDINGDSLIEADINLKWKEGMKFIYNETRRLTGNRFIILGNGTTREFKDDLNGKMLENFLPVSWGPTMNTYAYNFTSQQNPQINIINANTGNTGNANDYRAVRFGLTSTLLENGYYSFDYGDRDHTQTWWYDEYNVNLGEPASKSISQNNLNKYGPDLWQRDFSNGIVLVNSTVDNKVVNLGGDYEKIKGTQDKNINDGSIISEARIGAYDGLILLRTFTTLQDVVFKNGSFVRFYGTDGSRVRNGFFVFEAGFKGGDRIAHVDLDNDGVRDLVVASGNKLNVWRGDGQLYMQEFPYTANYSGELRIAVGDVNSDSKLEIIVAPGFGYPVPIKIYSFYGDTVKTNLLPLGNKYKGGFSVAVRQAGETNQLVVGAGRGVKPEVLVYDDKFKIIKRWLAFESGFRGGVNVTTGDVIGDKSQEIIVGAGVGKDPVIKIFNIDGKLLSQFTGYQTLNKSGTEVQIGDIDYDGKQDIFSFSDSGI